MSIITTILLILAGIVLLFLVVAAFVKKDFQLEKQVIINKPKQQVYSYVKMIRNQEHYSVWVMKDPNIKLLYTGTDGTIGFKSAWESNDKNVGIGEQEIIKLSEDESMDVEIRFKKPFAATNYAHNELTGISDSQTKLVQSFTGSSKYPMNIMNLFMDNLVGKAMQQSLQNLKNNVEKL